jgi:hypothetical protein
LADFKGYSMTPARYNTSKKDTEKGALEAARRAGAPIPDGEIQDFEEPDFKIETASGLVGIEVTELLPPAGSDSFSSPLAEKSFHEKVVHLAEQEYNRTPGAIPVKVTVYFWNREGGKYDKRDMAGALAEFVRLHRGEATPVATLTRRANLPEGFGVISISSTSGPWFGGESVGLTLTQIRQQIAERISAKNKRLPTYRANLPGASIWLLIYSCTEVSRGVPIPYCFAEWTFPFEFDRVFFFSSLDNKVEEIRPDSGGRR